MRGIAMIGMGCRFPDSSDLDGYWRTVREGRVCFREVPPDRWDLDFFYSDDRRALDKTYGRKMGLVADIRSFAPEFYGISPRRARVMDPQQRLLLDVTRMALEDAGYGRRALPAESTGVYVGATVSEHKDIITSRLHVPRALRRAFGRVPVLSSDALGAAVEDLVPMQAGSMVGQLLGMIAANVAQAFDFRGPAFAVDTACSSALVALHEAILHLRAGLIDAAVVGGVYLNLDCANPVCFSRIGALSPSDRCRPFDAEADGFVLGEGAGAVILKRLDDALRDGDRIWGVIRGLAMNNDGRSEGPMAPSATGQATVLRRAYRDAGVTPDCIGLLEAHGTATASGDQAEVAALKDVFESERAGPIDCAVGSVKANIGHTLAAAGVAGLIKAAMALEHGIIPPQAGYNATRPGLELDGTGFWFPREEHPWRCRADGSRFAAVSSFAFGGTNVHVVLEGPSARSRVPSGSAGRGPEALHSPAEPFLIAAPTSEQLAEHLGELETAIRGLDGRVTLADLAYTLSATRRHDRLRVAFTAKSRAELLAKLVAARDTVGTESAIPDGLWIGLATPETARTQLSGLPDHESGTPSAATPETCCAEAVVGRGPDPVSWFTGRDVRPVWLPHAPLATRDFWAVRSRSSEEVDSPDPALALEAPEPSDPVPAEPVVIEPETLYAPAVRTDPREIEKRIRAVVADVGSYDPERLRGDQRIMADLGFDSLMTFDLLVHLVKTFPALAEHRNELVESDLTVDALTSRIAEKLGETITGGPVAAGPPSPGSSEDRVVVRMGLRTHPWLDDHRIAGVPVIPMAAVLDCVVAALESRGVDFGPWLLSEVELQGGTGLVADRGDVVVRSQPGRERDERRVEVLQGERVVYRGLARLANGLLPALAEPDDGEPAELSAGSFYAQLAFHGPRLRSVVRRPKVGPNHVAGTIHVPRPGPHAAGALDAFAIDAALQLAAYWAATQIGRRALPIGLDAFCWFGPMPVDDELHVLATLRAAGPDELAADLDVHSAGGVPVAQLRGLRARLREAPAAEPGALLPIARARYRLEDFPEVRALRDRLDEMRARGLPVPYFRIHQGVTRDTTTIAGRDYINFSSYNYLGLSGDPDVTRSTSRAVARYGTSASASRVASGERPVHRELEAALARFLGCEDAIVLVSGHATNVSVLGHLLGPEDLIVHDALAHDSIIGGARLSGARRRPFAHNDMDALEEILATMRPQARRVLIAVEGVYSMDGDLAPLDRLISLKHRYRALLYVDEAHSLGVVGRTGRGIGEHFNVDRGDVDLWMGTLSKSLASCGGYIAGSSAAIEYLKYSLPGFVYSVGLSPANAAAALSALEKLESRPDLVARLRKRSRLFLKLCHDRGIDTGLSARSAVVPCIVGDSAACLRLAEALAGRGINVQPILAPAVPEHQARLRFFITARHTRAQLVTTADALAQEWARLGVDKAPVVEEACT
jgi:8-amino-7-oxononanoate synthase